MTIDRVSSYRYLKTASKEKWVDKTKVDAEIALHTYEQMSQFYIERSI